MVIVKCEFCDNFATVANNIVERDSNDMDNPANQTVLNVIYSCVTHKSEAMREIEMICERNYRRGIVKVEYKKW